MSRRRRCRRHLPRTTTPLNAKRLGQIIGQTPSVGASGVVTVDVPRANPITLGGVRINPFLNVYPPVSFEPLGGDTGG